MGLETYEERFQPERVGLASDWKGVYAGMSQTFAIKNNGTLWATGDNRYGTQGNGLFGPDNYVYAFTQIGTATNWAAATGNSGHSLALKTDGTLWSWGQNVYNALGDGTSTDRYVPAQIGTATNWKSVATASATSFALKTDGTLWSWGLNSSGILGIGQNSQSVFSRAVLVQVGLANDWKNIYGGPGAPHVIAIKNNNKLYTWGGCYGSDTSGNWYCMGFGFGPASNSNTSPRLLNNDTWLTAALGL